MNLRCVITAEARSEITEAMNWYEQAEAGLGSRFWLEFERLIRRLVFMPEIYPPYGKRGVRKARLQVFPYWVFYRVAGQELRILGVRHASRDPRVPRRRFA
jgi:plasmid stabilization system protein ParE